MAINSKRLRYFFLAFVFVTISTFSIAQDFEKVQIETIKVADGIYMLLGAGGNIGVSAGEDVSQDLQPKWKSLTLWQHTSFGLMSMRTERRCFLSK